MSTLFPRFPRAKKKDFATRLAKKALLETMLNEGIIEGFLIIIPYHLAAGITSMEQAGDVSDFISTVEERIRKKEYALGRNPLLNALGRKREFRGDPSQAYRAVCTPRYEFLFQWGPEKYRLEI